MKKLLLALPLSLLALSCSDQDMEKWKEMNKDRIEAAPNEDPNLPTTKADMDAVKENLRELKEKAQKTIDNIREENKDS